MRKIGVDGDSHRLTSLAKAVPPKRLTCCTNRSAPSGSWTFGSGTGHHLAMEVADDEALAAQKGIYEELGYTDCSEIKDRITSTPSTAAVPAGF